MNRRNWLGLSRKLVDRTDLDYSFNAVELYMAQNNLAFFGMGVLVTTTYPAPFPITMSGSALAGVVGTGIAYDPMGLQTRIDDSAGNFTVTAPDATNPRWDLLVLRYIAKGDTLIPEPDLPTENVYLNLHDGYQVAVLPGVASGVPAYPAKGTFDIILAGLQVPSSAAVGTDVVVDFSVREIAKPQRALFPVFKQEVPTGAIDGSNNSFTLSAAPIDATSVLLSVDGVVVPETQWSLSGATLTLATPPAPGQDVYAFYVVDAPGSVNPVSGIQEVPSGAVDGSNASFSLSGHPVDQNSTQVYVDGILVPASGWSLVQNPGVSKIIFQTGFIPQVGQDVYVFFLRNVIANYAEPVSSGGGGGGGGGSANLATEYPVLQASDLINGYVTLSNIPSTPAAVLLDILGGGAQAYSDDFSVAGNQLTWSSDLGAILEAGDKLRVHYAF